MASQYTKDITKSKVYKQATGQDEKLIDEIIGGLGVIKKFGDSKVAANIKTLQDEQIFDVQNKKNQLMQLNQFSVLEKELQDNFGGNLDAFSKAKAKELLDQRALVDLPVFNTTEQNLTVSYPDEAYGQTLIDSANAYKTNFTELRKKLGEAGIPYAGDAAKQGTFIDDAYQAVFDKISRANNFNVMKGMGSLFRGQGLNYSSAEDLKRSYNENVGSSKLSEIESLNRELKAIYNFSPELTRRIAETVKDADIRKDVKTTIGQKQKEEILDNETGQTRIINYIDSTVSYTDLDGRPQIETIRTELPDDPSKIKLAPIKEQVLYASLLENVQGAEEEYFRLINDENYLPDYAFRALPKKFKKSFTQIEADDFRRTNFKALADAHNTYEKDNYFYTDSFGNDVRRPEVVRYENDPINNPKPSYYKTLDDYISQFLPVEKRVNPGNVIGGDIAILDYNLANNSDWRSYIDSFEGQKEIRSFVKEVIPNESFLEDLKTEFQDGDRSRVDGLGNYFPTGQNAPVVNEALLREMGLENIIQNPQQLGYNVQTDKLVMKQAVPFTVDSKLEGGETEEERTFLQKVNDIPLLGNITELALGDELDLVDATWLIPGFGLVKIGGKMLAKPLINLAGRRVLNSPKTKKIIAKYLDMRKKGPLYGFKNQKAYDAWFKTLSGTDKAIINAISKSGKSFAPNTFLKNFVTIQGMKVAAFVPSMGTTAKWTVPIAAQAIFRDDEVEDIPAEEFLED